MIKRPFCQRLMRVAITIAIGGSAFQLSGCDPTVRDTLLTGLESSTQSLSAALISAFFQSLEDGGSVGGLTTAP